MSLQYPTQEELPQFNELDLDPIEKLNLDIADLNNQPLLNILVTEYPKKREVTAKATTLFGYLLTQHPSRQRFEAGIPYQIIIKIPDHIIPVSIILSEPVDCIDFTKDQKPDELVSIEKLFRQKPNTKRFLENRPFKLIHTDRSPSYVALRQCLIQKPAKDANKTGMRPYFPANGLNDIDSKDHLGKGNFGAVARVLPKKFKLANDNPDATLVFKERNPEKPKIVVKRIRKDEKLQSREFHEEVEKEVRLTKKAADDYLHPRPAIYIDDAEPEQQEAYLFMDEVSGKTIDQLDLSSLDFDDRLTILIDIATTMSEIHQREVIFRDVNEKNIFANGKIVDFGLAKDTPAVRNHQAKENGVGTPMYSPPESFAFRRTDERSDIYSLGGLFAKILGAKNVGKKRDDAVQARQLPSPGQIRFDLSGLFSDLDDVFDEEKVKVRTLITKMVQEQQDHRPDNIGAIAAQFKQIQRNHREKILTELRSFNRAVNRSLTLIDKQIKRLALEETQPFRDHKSAELTADKKAKAAAMLENLTDIRDRIQGVFRNPLADSHSKLISARALFSLYGEAFQDVSQEEYKRVFGQAKRPTMSRVGYWATIFFSVVKGAIDYFGSGNTHYLKHGFFAPDTLKMQGTVTAQIQYSVSKSIRNLSQRSQEKENSPINTPRPLASTRTL